MLEFDLDKGRRTVQVTIGGEPYEARLGNLTFALDAKLLGEKMRAISEDGLSAEEAVARAEDFAGLARSMAPRCSARRAPSACSAGPTGSTSRASPT